MNNTINTVSTALVSQNYPVSIPVPTDLGAYARAVAEIPALSAKEEKALALAWRDEQSQDAAKILVLSQLRLVLKIARDHQGYGVSPADLVQEGTVGLMKAVQKFDPDRGIRLSTYSWYWIEAEIKEFILKNWRMISWGTSSLAKKIFFGYRKTVQQLRSMGENRKVPSLQEIAEAMDIKEDDAKMAQAYFLGSDVHVDGTDAFADESDFGISSKSFTLPFLASEEEDPAEKAEESDQANTLSTMHKAMQKLPQRERDILHDRFLLEKPKTLQELSLIHGVSVERCRQIEKKALLSIRMEMQEQE